MNVIYFSTLAWDEAGGAHNPTRLTRALARRGARVLFVEPQPSRTRAADELPIEITALTDCGMSAGQLRRAWYGLDSGALEPLVQCLAARASSLFDTSARLALYAAPFDPYVRLAPLLRAQGYHIVYYAMDDFAAAPALGYTQFAPAAQAYLERNSDLLLAVTPHTAQALTRGAAGTGRTAHVLPNGIERAELARPSGAPPAVARGELTLGFWGTVMESLVDAELLAHVAAARPQWTIHLLGAVDPEPHRPSVAEALKPFPNVYLHGALPHAELSAYAAAFDVALAPFPDTDFTRGRDPLKVYEYLAAQLPVAAAYTPQLDGVPYVHVADSPAAFVRAIEDAASETVDERVCRDYLTAQTWDARAATFLDLMNTLPPPAVGGDAAILPSFAQPTLAAVLRYANALELELDAMEGWARELEQLAAARGGWQRVKQLLSQWYGSE